MMTFRCCQMYWLFCAIKWLNYRIRHPFSAVKILQCTCICRSCVLLSKLFSLLCKAVSDLIGPSAVLSIFFPLYMCQTCRRPLPCCQICLYVCGIKWSSRHLSNFLDSWWCHYSLLLGDANFLSFWNQCCFRPTIPISCVIIMPEQIIVQTASKFSTILILSCRFVPLQAMLVLPPPLLFLNLSLLLSSLITPNAPPLLSYVFLPLPLSLVRNVSSLIRLSFSPYS